MGDRGSKFVRRIGQGLSKLGGGLIRHWLQVVVVGFWVSTMSWLVVEVVLPPLSRGDPPTFYGGLDPDARPICWSVSFAEKQIGWAIIRAVRPATASLEVQSRVHFSRLPVKEMVSGWKPSLIATAAEATLGSLELDAFNRVEIGPLHRLNSFRSSIRLSQVPQAIVIEGTPEETRMRIHVDLGGMVPDPPDQFLSPDALVVDELSPQASLPGLYVGQSWTEPVYNPMLSGGQLEMLQATVEANDLRSWNGRAVEAMRVAYRGDSGASSDATASPLGLMWVTADGMVIRQEMSLLGSRLVFDRLAADDAASWPSGLAAALKQGNYGSHGLEEPRPGAGGKK